jgi:hypothetical protein
MTERIRVTLLVPGASAGPTEWHGPSRTRGFRSCARPSGWPTRLAFSFAELDHGGFTMWRALPRWLRENCPSL